MTEQEAEARRLADRLWDVNEPNDMIVRRQASRLLRGQEERIAKAEQERDVQAVAAYENGYALGLAQGWEKAEARERELQATIADLHASTDYRVIQLRDTLASVAGMARAALQATQEDGAADE